MTRAIIPPSGPNLVEAPKNNKKYEVVNIRAKRSAGLGRAISITTNKKATTIDAKIISATANTLLSALSERITKKTTKQLTATKGILYIMATQTTSAQIRAIRQLKSIRSGVGSRSSLTCPKSVRQNLLTLLLIVNHYIGRRSCTKQITWSIF